MRALFVICTVLIATPAFAQQPDAAEVAYREGRNAYDLREWDKAIASFKEAYRLRSDPKSLFNIAQSYRQKGDCVEALGFYKTYKRNYPTASNITTVDRLIAEVESCAKQQGKASISQSPTTSSTSEPAPPAGVASPPPVRQPAPPAVVAHPPPAREPAPPVGVANPPPVRQPAPQSPAPQPTRSAAASTHERTPTEGPATGRGQRIAGLAIAGGGVALVATGVIFGVTAASKSDAVTNGGDPSNPPVFDPTIESNGKRFDTIAEVCWGVGGAAIIGGTVVYLLGRRTSSTQVGIVPDHGGAVVTWGGAL